MATLPTLKSGQTVQYPLHRSLNQTVETIAFMDGTEQRCASSRALHQWTIQYGLLDEQEISALETFVNQVQGESGQFAFTDPADGVQYPNCSLSMQILNESFQGPGRVSATLVIRENPN
jgi:phage-related protein